MYEGDADWTETRTPILNPAGYADVKKRIRAEQKARREVVKDWVGIVSPFVTPLASALIGAISALVARSCGA